MFACARLEHSGDDDNDEDDDGEDASAAGAGAAAVEAHPWRKPSLSAFRLSDPGSGAALRVRERPRWATRRPRATALARWSTLERGLPRSSFKEHSLAARVVTPSGAPPRASSSPSRAGAVAEVVRTTNRAGLGGDEGSEADTCCSAAVGQLHRRCTWRESFILW